MLGYSEEIKKPGSKSFLGQDEIQEYLKCSKDPAYFIEKYCKIINPFKGVIDFNLYGNQKFILNEYQNNDKNITLKVRQKGNTTINLAYILWYLIFNKDKPAAVGSCNVQMSCRLIDIFKFMYENLPYWLKPGVETYNSKEIFFENGSYIIASAITPCMLRGWNVSLLYLDEFAYVRDGVARDFWESAYPVFSYGTKVLVTSSDEQVNQNNLFLEIYNKARNGENNFNAIDIKY